MSFINRTTGAALALAAASLVGCAGISGDSSGSAAKDVHCYGVNKCKGHNDCKTASNACKGHASCKGQGFISMPEESCDHVGGKVGA